MDIIADSFKVSKINIINQEELATYIESDLDFDELMLKMQHKLEEKEEKQLCQKKQQEE